MRTVTSSPHIHCGDSTQKIMFSVCLAMTPACIFGICIFGLRALVVLCVSIAAAVLTEYLLGLISHEYTIWDGSAVVTGMLIGMNMSPSIPLFIPVLASVFAIAVVKWTFGGLGANWANPAIAGRIFVFFSFTSAMSSYPMPKALLAVDALSSASPTSLIKTAIMSGDFYGKTSTQILSLHNYPASAFSTNLSQITGFNAYNLDSFIGFIPGCIGEVSALLLILGAIYLLVKKIITWHIPVSYLGSFCILTYIFGGIPFGFGLFEGEVFSSVMRGGLMLGALFMATDMVTSPLTHKGQIIFGIGCGFFTFLIRYFGSLPEATSVAILLMNILTPTINKFCVPKLFGSKEVVK